MKFLLPLLLGMIILVQSCTGQNPAPIKNSTYLRRAVKASCSSIKFEGQILSKKNILNIFDCSGWAKQYPELTKTIRGIDETSFNNVFESVNETFFSTRIRRKSFYELVARSEYNGELKSLSYVLEKSLADHKILSQVNSLLNSGKLDSKNKANLFKVISSSNEQNLSFLRAFKNIVTSYEFSKPIINAVLSDKEKNELPERLEVLLNDISNDMDSRSWKHLSGIVFSEDSPIQNWAIEGATGNLRVLLDIIEEPNFKADVTFLERSLYTKIKCENQASSKSFNINVGQELKHKIEGLKFGTKESFEDLILHGLAKFLAFQEFCEEKKVNQGLKSFYMVLKHAFKIIPSNHDYSFLKRIHQVFGEDRFVFLSFLSSQTFSALQGLLVELEPSGRDEQFVRSLYEVLSGLSINDLTEASKLLKEISDDKSQSAIWLKSWSQAWNHLSSENKKEFARFFGVFLDNEVRASDVISFFERVLTRFPEFSEKLFLVMENNKTQNDVLYLTEQFSKEGTQKNLSEFLSNKGLFEFIEIMTHESGVQNIKNERDSSPLRTHAAYVENIQTIETNQTRTCFNNLSNTYSLNTNYYNLVNTLPESCLNILGDVGFVGQIYLWMNSSDRYFRNVHSVNDFHSGIGVWSPGMLQFLFSAGIKADLNIRSKDGSRGIINNVDEIHRIATDPLLLEMFHQFSEIYSTFNSTINFDSRLLNYVEIHTNVDFNKLATHAFKIIKSNKPYTNIDARNTNCLDIDSELGVDPCLSAEEVTLSSLKILRVLKRKNERGSSLVKELVRLFHPQEGIELPFGQEKTRKHKATIDETIRFLYDLSSKKTVIPFEYQDNVGKRVVNGSVIDRVEVVIRDISFENNFYGAYYKNMVASAADYKKNVSGSEKLLKALDHSGGVMRRMNALSDDSKNKLKNVRESYSSLIELSDKYLQPDGTFRSYDGLIQGLLAAVAESSKLSTQKFNPYRIPNENIVKGHNGEFLTEVVKISGLRHLSSFVRSHFDTNLSALNTPEFKKIDKNLIGRIGASKIQNGIQSLLDQYLDNDRNQINLLTADVIQFLGSLTESEKKDIEEIILEGLLLISDERISSANLEEFAAYAEVLIQSWPEVRGMFLKVESQKELLSLLNKMMDGLSENPDSLNSIFRTIITSNLFNAQDLNRLLQNDSLISQATLFLNQLVKTTHLKSDLNWIETFEIIFASPDMKWDSITNWMQVALGQKKNKLTVSLLISFLGEKHGNQYRLQGIMDELFLNHRDQLSQFLNETFKSLELDPD